MNECSEAAEGGPPVDEGEGKSAGTIPLCHMEHGRLEAYKPVEGLCNVSLIAIDGRQDSTLEMVLLEHALYRLKVGRLRSYVISAVIPSSAECVTKALMMQSDDCSRRSAWRAMKAHAAA